jgi:hypothetical protein
MKVFTTFYEDVILYVLTTYTLDPITTVKTATFLQNLWKLFNMENDFTGKS